MHCHFELGIKNNFVDFTMCHNWVLASGCPIYLQIQRHKGTYFYKSEMGESYF